MKIELLVQNILAVVILLSIFLGCGDDRVDKSWLEGLPPDVTLSDIENSFLKYADTLDIRSYVKSRSDELYGTLSVSAWGKVTGVLYFRNKARYFAIYKSSSVNNHDKGRDTYYREIDSDDWIQVKKIYVEYDFWEEAVYKSPETEALDGYIIFVIGKNTIMNRLNKVVVRSTPQYDKMGTLSDHIFDYEQYMYESDTLNRELGFYKPLEF